MRRIGPSVWEIDLHEKCGAIIKKERRQYSETLDIALEREKEENVRDGSEHELVNRVHDSWDTS